MSNFIELCEDYGHNPNTEFKKFNEENLTINLDDYLFEVFNECEYFVKPVKFTDYTGIEVLYENINNYWSKNWLEGLERYADEVGEDFISDIVMNYANDYYEENEDGIIYT